MVGRLGAQLALLAFAIAVLAGISVGNSPTTVLIRALSVMVMALFVAQLAAWTGRLVLEDHLSHKKARVDMEHCERMEDPQASGAAPAESTSQSGQTSAPAVSAAG